MVSKALRYLGLAKKAGAVVTGSHTCTVNMKKSGIRLLIITQDMAENGKKKIVRTAEHTGTPYAFWGSSEDLSRITGTAGRFVFGITDERFAGVILQEIHKREE